MLRTVSGLGLGFFLLHLDRLHPAQIRDDRDDRVILGLLGLGGQLDHGDVVEIRKDEPVKAEDEVQLVQDSGGLVFIWRTA